MSYSSQNKLMARRLYVVLKYYGVDLFMDCMDIRGGQHWDRTIHTALRDCTHLLLVHTQDSFNSDNVWDEWSFCLNRKKTVIPLIFEDVELPFRLERLQYVDFCSQSFEAGIQNILEILQVTPPTPPDNNPLKSIERPVLSAEPHNNQLIDTEENISSRDLYSLGLFLFEWLNQAEPTQSGGMETTYQQPDGQSTTEQDKQDVVDRGLILRFGREEGQGLANSIPTEAILQLLRENSRNADLNGSGWETEVFLGREDVPEHFEIVLILAPPTPTDVGDIDREIESIVQKRFDKWAQPEKIEHEILPLTNLKKQRWRFGDNDDSINTETHASTPVNTPI